MAISVGINGFGRMGRLPLRAGWDAPDLQFVHVNEIAVHVPLLNASLTDGVFEVER